MKYFLILKLMLISKIVMSQIMLPAYQGVISKIPTVANIPCPGLTTITDVDNNSYNTVLIGTQCWTKENLKVTKYSDGVIIIPLNATGGSTGTSSTWQNLTTGSYTIYGNESSTGANATNYGFLYNWYAAKGITTTGSTTYKNLCPLSWHVPTDAEWTNLSTYLGGESVAGGKMESTSSLWNAINTAADNSSGFSALPGGFRDFDGSFYFIRSYAFFWSATENDINLNPWTRYLDSNNGNVYSSSSFFKSVGAAVRCLKD